MAINTEAMNPLEWGINQLSGALAAVTVDPFTDLITYVHPQFGADLCGRIEIPKKGHTPINHILSRETIDSLHREVTAIKCCAELNGNLKIYTNVEAPYEGKGSIFGHALVIPLEQISKRIFKPQLQEEPLLDAATLPTNKDHFTDNEIRFQIARSISQMKGHSHLKIAARVIVVALAIFLIWSPIGWMGGLIVFAGASLLYCPINFYIESKSDRLGIELSMKRFKESSGFTTLGKAEIEATTAAINCLKKVALQNIDKRKVSQLFRMLITETGNIRLDPSTPLLTNRIKKLEKKLAELKGYFPQAVSAPPPQMPALVLAVVAPAPALPIRIAPPLREAAIVDEEAIGTFDPIAMLCDDVTRVANYCFSAINRMSA